MPTLSYETQPSASLPELDRELCGGVPGARAAALARQCRVRALRLPRGDWDVSGLVAGGYGLLVVDGALCRRVLHSDRYGAELVGPGDLLRPWDGIGWSSIPIDSEWTALTAVRLAVLDEDFARRAAPFPEICCALGARALRRADRLATLQAIIAQRRVELRLLLLFDHLADRFGVVRRAGEADIPLRLSHRLLSEMVGARRPSVSAALGELAERGLLVSRNRRWVLSLPVR